jgi:hypothetical protein
LIRPVSDAEADTFRAGREAGGVDGRGDAVLAVAFGLLVRADAEGDAEAGFGSRVAGVGVPRVAATAVAAAESAASVSWSGPKVTISTATSATAAATAAETRAVRRLPDEEERCERDATGASFGDPCKPPAEGGKVAGDFLGHRVPGRVKSRHEFREGTGGGRRVEEAVEAGAGEVAQEGLGVARVVKGPGEPVGELLVVPDAAQTARRIGVQGGVVAPDGVAHGPGEEIGIVQGEVHALAAHG